MVMPILRLILPCLIDIVHRLEQPGYGYILAPGVLIYYILGLLEASPVIQPQFLPLVEVRKPECRPLRLVRILQNYAHDIGSHLHLLGTLPPIPAQILGLVVGEVGVEPDPDLAVLVDQDLMLGDMEPAHLGVQFLVALQHGHRAVQVVGVGDVLVLAEPGPAVLQVHVQHVGGGAELLHDLGLEVHHPHDVGLVAPVRHRLQVLVVLLLAGELQQVPVQKLTRYSVLHDRVVPGLVQVRVRRLDLLPVVGPEGRVGFGLMVPHVRCYFIIIYLTANYASYELQ